MKIVERIKALDAETANILKAVASRTDDLQSAMSEEEKAYFVGSVALLSEQIASVNDRAIEQSMGMTTYEQAQHLLHSIESQL